MKKVNNKEIFVWFPATLGSSCIGKYITCIQDFVSGPEKIISDNAVFLL